MSELFLLEQSLRDAAHALSRHAAPDSVDAAIANAFYALADAMKRNDRIFTKEDRL